MIETHEKIRYCCDCQRYQAGGIYDKCVIEVPLRDCVTGKRILSVRSASEERSTGSCGLEALYFVPKTASEETPVKVKSLQITPDETLDGLSLLARAFAENLYEEHKPKTRWQRLKARLWK